MVKTFSPSRGYSIAKFEIRTFSLRYIPIFAKSVFASFLKGTDKDFVPYKNRFFYLSNSEALNLPWTLRPLYSIFIFYMPNVCTSADICIIFSSEYLHICLAKLT